MYDTSLGSFSTMRISCFLSSVFMIYMNMIITLISIYLAFTLSSTKEFYLSMKLEAETLIVSKNECYF